MTVKKPRINAGKLPAVVKQSEADTNTADAMADNEPRATSVSKSASEVRGSDSGKQKESRQEYMPGRRVWPD
jgi:hypothetical protein